ncbi:MAG: DNRLRE domain-containing protein [Xanthomonadales bacterium]|nr:DNRLRE domain-containing protein [Xanthomonadales bacterium]
MKAVALAVILLSSVFPAWAQTVSNPSAARDTAIYSENDNSNGIGTYLFSGVTRQGDFRRSLIAFNLSGIPAGATVTDVTLTLNVSLVAPVLSSTTVSLHEVRADWAEGTSNAGSPGGQGAAPTQGDATWNFRSFSTDSWADPGGDFANSPSASTTIINLTGPYDWTGAGLISDVQGWINNPGSNRGWILVGDEAGLQNAVRYDSREAVNPADRPQLTVTYTAPTGVGQTGPIAVPTMGLPGLLLLALILGGLGMFRARKD